MTDIPHCWEGYARFQRRLAKTTCVTTAAALEAALNVVHRADFKPKGFTDDVLKRVADTAGRRERDRLQLLRRYAASQQDGSSATPGGLEAAVTDIRPRSLDDAVHASCELSRLQTMMPAPDWELLLGVAVGASYEDLAVDLATSSCALRSRVSRLRQVIA